MVDQVPSWATDQQSETPSWAVEPPSAWQDIANTAGPSLGRGTVAAVTAIPTLADLSASGLDWLANTKAAKAVLPEGAGAAVHKAAETAHDINPFTYSKVMDKIQQESGPLYEAKTTPGKYVQSALEFLPSAVYGGGGLGQRLLTSALGGVGSQAGGDVATSVGAPEWAGRLAGGVVGAIGGPKLIKGANVSPQAAQNAKTLEDAGMKLTAGQATQNPWMLQREANLMTPGRQAAEASQFTQAAANQSGMPGVSKLDQGAFKVGKQNVQANNTAIENAEIKPPGFAALNNELANIRRQSFRDIGQNQTIDDLIDKVKLGPQAGSGPQPLSMLGGRYQALREDFQHAIDNAATSKERNYLSQMRKALDDAMGNEFTPGELEGMHKTTANYNTLAGAKLDNGTVTPEGLHQAIAKRWGENAYNQGNGMSPLAQAGESALSRPPPTEPGSLVRSAGALGGWLLGKHVAPAEGAVGGIFGRDVLPDLMRLATRNPITRGAYFNPVTQSYLRNGVPGLNKLIPPNAAVNPSSLVRMLAGPEAMGAAPTRVTIDVPKRLP